MIVIVIKYARGNTIKTVHNTTAKNDKTYKMAIVLRPQMTSLHPMYI